MSHIPLTLIAAIAQNGVIGRDNRLPWHLTSDLKRFRALTMGKPMIMGRKNFESIGRNLPGRETIVVTRNPSFTAEGVHIVHDIETALACAKDRAKAMQADEIILAGGAEIYAALIDQAETMHITMVDLDPPLEPHGITIFPPIDWSQWSEDTRLRPPKDDKDEATFTFIDYRRRHGALMPR